MRTSLLSRILLPLGFGVLALGQAPAVAPPKVAPVKPPVVKREPGLYCDMTIVQGTAPLGTITLMLFEKESPITVKNFADLAMGRKEYINPMTRAKSRLPFYNGLTFHRVIPGFMIQGGDPTGSGSGRTAEIPDEFHPSLKFDVPGRLAMANAGLGTGSCQFFITEGTPTHLDGKHTIFGQVVSGQELVGKIARVPSGAAGQNKPDVPVKMARVRVYREPQVAPVPVQKKAVPAAPKPAAPKPAVVAPKPVAPKPAPAK